MNDKEEAYEHYKQYRDSIKHEDTLSTLRMNVLFVSQSFLAFIYDKEQPLENLFVCTIAIIICLKVLEGVLAANAARKEIITKSGDYDNTFYKDILKTLPPVHFNYKRVPFNTDILVICVFLIWWLWMLASSFI